MDTGVSVSVDVALILTALAPTIAILTTAWLQSRERKRDSGKLDAVHTLVNDQMTIEKAHRLKDLARQRRLLRRLIPDPDEADRQMMAEMDDDIRELSDEVQWRNLTADRIAAANEPQKGD